MTAAQPATVQDLDRLFTRIEKMVSDVVGTVVSEIVGDALQLISDRFDRVDKRFEQMDRRFEQIDKRFDRMDKRFDGLESKLNNTVDRVDHHTIDIRALRRKTA